MALGAAAGVLSMIKRQAAFEKPVPHLPKTDQELTPQILASLLKGLWADKADHHADKLIALTWTALQTLGRGDPEK
jgi:hypothetical protein